MLHQRVNEIKLKLPQKNPQKTTGRVSIQFDCWTSPNEIGFLGVIATFADDGTFRSEVIGFEPLIQSHDAYLLADTLLKILDFYGIASKVCTLFHTFGQLQLKFQRVFTICHSKTGPFFHS